MVLHLQAGATHPDHRPGRTARTGLGDGGIQAPPSTACCVLCSPASHICAAAATASSSAAAGGICATTCILRAAFTILWCNLPSPLGKYRHGQDQNIKRTKELLPEVPG